MEQILQRYNNLNTVGVILEKITVHHITHIKINRKIKGQTLRRAMESAKYGSLTKMYSAK